MRLGPDRRAGSSVLKRVGRLRWAIRTHLWRDELNAVLDRPDESLAAAGTVYKQSRNVSVACIPSNSSEPRGWVLRRLNYGTRMLQLRDTFRRSRAHRALRHSAWLEQAGVPTARVVAAADDRFLRWPRRGYVLSEEIEQPITLAQLLARHQPLPRSGVAELAGLLGRLHQHGLSHRDLKASNVLFNGQGHPFLVDLDGVRRVRFAARSRAVADLARLARDITFGPTVSVWSAVHFLQTYCRHRGSPDWRWWWRAIERRLG